MTFGNPCLSEIEKIYLSLIILNYCNWKQVENYCYFYHF